MPSVKLPSVFKQRIGRIFRRSSRHGNTSKVLPQKIGSSSFEEGSSTEETLRLSESELSLSTYAGDGSSKSLLAVQGEYETEPESETEKEETETKQETQVATKTQTEAEVSTKKKSNKKQVSFSHVQVRHYELILGDNPGCRYPLSIGWNYQLEEDHHVDHYEEKRTQERTRRLFEDRISPRLYGREGDDHDMDIFDGLPEELTLYERRMRLRAFGYSEAQLRQEERKRQCRTALEWGGGGTPRFPHCDAFIQRYARE